MSHIDPTPAAAAATIARFEGLAGELRTALSSDVPLDLAHYETAIASACAALLCATAALRGARPSEIGAACLCSASPCPVSHLQLLTTSLACARFLRNACAGGQAFQRAVLESSGVAAATQLLDCLARHTLMRGDLGEDMAELIKPSAAPATTGADGWEG